MDGVDLEAWTRDETSASGQVFEFRLWAALTEQSEGSLHPFLPLADRGIDALVHRLSDGTYLSVQAKGRSTLSGGEVQLVVWANSLRDDKAFIVGGLITGGALGPTMLVVREEEFKRLASRTHWGSQPIYSMSFGMKPRSDSRWLPYLVATDHIAERFVADISSPFMGRWPEGPEGPTPMWRSDLGFLGESEVVRLLAESGELNVFRPFPDLETSELAVLHLESRRVIGVQVKTGGVDAGHPAAGIKIRASSFRPSPRTYFVVLAWLREKNQFHEKCLLIPSELMRSVCQPGELDGHLKFDWNPESAAQRHLNPFRISIETMRGEIANRLTR
jgi:hypothetical protein